MSNQYRLKVSCWLVAVLTFSFFGSTSGAQNNPTFTGGGKLSQTSSGSPSMATNTSTGVTCMVYQDHSTGDLAAVSSTNSASWGNAVNTGYSMYNSYVVIAYFSSEFVVLFETSTGFQETTSTNCTSFTAETQTFIDSPYGYNGNYQPGLAVWTPSGGSTALYLSVIVGLPGGGNEPAVLSSTDGINYYNFEVPYGGDVNSGTSLLAYTPPGASGQNLYLAFTQGANNLPVIAQTSNGSTWTSSQDTSFEIGGDPNLVAFTASGNTSQAIYIFGRSNYSANNLWVAGTYDGVNFTSAYEYGMSLHDSPSDVVGSNGDLISSFHSNFSSNNLWSYYAPY
jgi:hypothetical protein